jgi:acetoin utilization deacetylase AcuC-like enzyme
MFRAYSSSAYTIDLPEGHRFPMYKYAGTREKLVQDGVLPASQIIDPPRPSWDQVERVHTSEYLKKLRFGELEPKELRLLGFPWSSSLVERAMRAVGGTMSAAHDALRVGLGINLAGGTHHAFPAHGEGFCVLNDVAIASMGLLENAQVSRIFVLDLDVHQGNGTAAIFEHDSRVFTLSVHGERNYPFHKEHSSLDIGLADGVTDAEYLDVFESRVQPALQAFRPEIVFYLAGVDVLAKDRFGRFALSITGAQDRDRRVFQTCRNLKIPVVSLMSGGYNKDHAVTVSGHANTVAAALEVFR